MDDAAAAKPAADEPKPAPVALSDADRIAALELRVEALIAELGRHVSLILDRPE